MANIKGCRDYGCDRREFLTKLGKFGLGLSVLGGLSLEKQLFMKEAYGVTPQGDHYDAIIQIFLRGGPSQTDTFDLKPGSRNNWPAFNQTINLGAQDVYGNDILLPQAVLPNIANLIQNDPDVGCGIIRSLTHSSNNHEQGREFMFSGWQGTSLVDTYPTMAPVMAEYFKGHPFGVPSVVIENSLSRRGVVLEANLAKLSRCPIALQVNADTAGSAGDPVLATLQRPPGVTEARYQRRMSVLQRMNAAFNGTRAHVDNQAWANSCEEAYGITSNGAAAQAFDLTGVPLVTAESTSVARRLTLATRLVESGVNFVLCAIGGSDTHRGNEAAVRRIWGIDVDQGVTDMLGRLKASGKRVLVCIGGEFGRTPSTVVDGRDGRDHWGDGFTWVCLSVNQPKFVTTAYGSTGPDGLFRNRTGDLVDPVFPKDFVAFLYRAMGFQVGDVPGVFNIPMQDRTAPPVNRDNNSQALLQAFGLV
jgi:uncharacterized protein (DUF1501 family)